METEVKVEQSDSSDDETLAVQFKSNITGGKDGGNNSDDSRMIPGTNYMDDDGDEDCPYGQIKALKYRLLDAKLMTSWMKQQSMVCDLTRNFEEKNRWKLFQLIVLLKCAVDNILRHGVITRWDWDFTLKEVMKVHHKKYTGFDMRIKTIEILDWFVEKHPEIVIGWKVDAHGPLPEPDVMSDEEVAMETERDKDEFVVVKAEEDDPLTSMKNIGLEENTEEDEESASLDVASLDAASLDAASQVPVSLEPVSLDSIKTEEEEVEPTQAQGGEIPVEAIKTEVDADMETEKDTGERFFHNGEELDLEDVLDHSPKHSDAEDNKKKTESDSEAEGPPEEEKEEEEDEEKDDEDEYIPDESEEDDDEASDGEIEEEEKKQDGEEEDDEDDDDDEEDEEDDEDSKAGNVSTSLTMLKQALMRKRGQSHAHLTSSKGSDGLNGATNYTIPKVTPVDMKPSDPNIGGTTLNFSDLSDLERTVLESAVAGRMSMFKSTICTVEEREKKMSVWKDIAARVNNVVRGKLWTPEELVTIWSKKLFIEHVGSKKSLIVNKVDQLLNGDDDKTAFKSLISKSQNKSAADSIQFTIPGHTQTSSHCQTKFGPVQPIIGAVKKRELTPEESAVLQEQVDIYKEMFHSKREEVRAKIWKEITKKVNAVDPRTYRTVDELKRRWTKDLIQAKLKLSSTVGHRSSGRPNTGYVIEKSKPSSEASASMSVPDSDLPIKIELDNAESDQTQILSVVPSSSSSTIRSILSQPKVSTQPSSSKVPSTSIKSSSGKRSNKTSVPLLYGRTPPLKERPLSSKTTHQADSDPSASLARLKRGPPRLTTVTNTELVLYQLTDKTTMVRSSVTVPKACVRLQLVDQSQSGAAEVKGEPADDTVFTPDQYKVLTRLIQQKIDVIKLTGPSIVSLVLNSTDWEKLVRLVNKADLSHVHSVPNVKTKVRTIVTSLDNLLSMKNKKPGNNEEPSPSLTEDPDIPPIIPAKKIKVEPHDSLVNPRLAKGDMVKAKHQGCWIEGIIVDIDKDECRAKIHFHGLSRQNNSWLPMTKDFITESTRCYVKLPKLPRKI